MYLWIHNFCQKNTNIIDTSELKKSLKMNTENKLIHRHMPIYNQILKKLEEDGKITDEVRKWHIA